jgi:light-regulated signal transduction histidine kinase (bacteriophytochrome)
MISYETQLLMDSPVALPSTMQPMMSSNETHDLRERLARSERETQRFLEGLVHDVRATQRVINTCAELLLSKLEGQLAGETLMFTQQIQDSVSKMDTLLSGVSVYCMSLPSARYSFGVVPMETALRLALYGLAAQISQCAATVTHVALPQVRGDIERLTWLFQNLIGNALTYRGVADPRIDVQSQADGDFWRFSVQDNGLGIAQKYWDGLYAPFHRLHGPEIPGVGLGLTICKNILDVHGGKIWIESEPGKGSTFFFTLPAAGEET